VGLGVEREPWHQGIGVGICPYSSGIEVELTAPDEARLLTEIDDRLEEAVEEVDAELLPDAG
jgi:hypothetical protein